MLVTVSSVTVPSPLELSVIPIIIYGHTQLVLSVILMPTVNQLNSLAGQSTKTMKTSTLALPVIVSIFCRYITHGFARKIVTISSFLHFLISPFLHFLFLLLSQPKGFYPSYSCMSSLKTISVH